MVRQQFRMRLGETDEDKIVEFKEDAMRAMGNYALMEAARIKEQSRGDDAARARAEAAQTNLDGRID